jgi:sugar O-acyltransferase (sialic acid O-acetyltransferase NeuD family)
MKKIYILGTGGFAREVYFLISDINKVNMLYDVSGFIDINPKIKNVTIGNKQIAVFNEDTFFNTELEENSCFAIGIGNPKVLNSIKEKYLEKFNFPNLIHPNVIGLFETIKIGMGNIITAGCIFTLDIIIGSLNIFNLHTTLGHDAVIENCNVFNPGVNISGGVSIGNNNLIGTNSCILQYVKIGDNNAIGAGAVVNTTIENNKVAVGVPAKVIKENN